MATGSIRDLFSQRGTYGIIPFLSSDVEGMQMRLFGLDLVGWKFSRHYYPPWRRSGFSALGIAANHWRCLWRQGFVPGWAGTPSTRLARRLASSGSQLP